MAKFEFDLLKTWTENFNEASVDFQNSYNTASDKQKPGVFVKYIKNYWQWPSSYEMLDGLEDDYMVTFLLQNLGLTINEAATTITSTKKTDDYLEIDKKIIEISKNSSIKSGTYLYNNQGVNVDFDLDKLNINNDNTNNKDYEPLKEGLGITFKDIYLSIHKYSMEDAQDQEKLEYGSVPILVDSEHNLNMLTRARDKMFYLAYVVLSPVLAMSIVGNSYIGARILNFFAHVIEEVHEKLKEDCVCLLEEKEYKDIQRKLRNGEPLSDDDETLMDEKLGPGQHYKIWCPFDEEEIEAYLEEYTILKLLLDLCSFVKGKYHNPKLPTFYRKINVTFHGLVINNLVDLRGEIIGGKALPFNFMNYLHDYKLTDLESFRKSYFGPIKNVNLSFIYKCYLSEFNDFELNLIFRNAPGRKIMRYLIIILLLTPLEILNLDNMPSHIRCIYETLLILEFNDQQYAFLELLDLYLPKKEKKTDFEGVIKNLLNYLIYWICRGHSEYIVHLFKLFERFEQGARFNTHKQVLNMIDTESFLLYKFDLSEEDKDLYSEEKTKTIIKSLYLQIWNQKSNIADCNTMILGKESNCFYRSILKDQDSKNYFDLQTKETLTEAEVTSVRILAKKIDFDLDKYEKDLHDIIDLDSIREHFNTHYHRNVETSLIKISTEAWNKFFSDITGKEVDFCSLNFLTKQSIDTSMSLTEEWGATNYEITYISPDEFTYMVKKGDQERTINQLKKTGRILDLSKLREAAKERKDSANMDRLKRKYQKFLNRNKGKEGGDGENEPGEEDEKNKNNEKNDPKKVVFKPCKLNKQNIPDQIKKYEEDLVSIGIPFKELVKGTVYKKHVDKVFNNYSLIIPELSQELDKDIINEIFNNYLGPPADNQDKHVNNIVEIFKDQKKLMQELMIKYYPHFLPEDLKSRIDNLITLLPVRISKLKSIHENNDIAEAYSNYCKTHQDGITLEEFAKKKEFEKPINDIKQKNKKVNEGRVKAYNNAMRNSFNFFADFFKENKGQFK